MTLNEILARAKEDLEQKYTDPIQRLESNSDKALRYSELLFRITRQRNTKKIEVNSLYSKLYKEAKFNSSYLLKSKQDIDSFIETDESYNSIKHQLIDLDNLVQLLSNMVDIYKQREASERLIFKAKTGIG
jgi:hypothetical protein